MKESGDGPRRPAAAQGCYCKAGYCKVYLSVLNEQHAQGQAREGTRLDDSFLDALMTGCLSVITSLFSHQRIARSSTLLELVAYLVGLCSRRSRVIYTSIQRSKWAFISSPLQNSDADDLGPVCL